MAIAPGSMETAELMFGCFKRMHRILDHELGGCGLSLSRTKLLSELDSQGPMHQGALAAVFGLAPRTVTELVDTLERDGLVERRTDPADRRARLVLLTPAGGQALARAAGVRQRVVDQVLSGMGDRQLAGLRSALQLIGAEIDKIEAGTGATGSAGAAGGAVRTP